jgi:hypothetical protein
MRKKGDMIKLKSGWGIIHKVSIVKSETVYQVYGNNGLEIFKEKR